MAESLVLASQSTVNGSYNFSGLALGDYIVQVTDADSMLTGFVLTSGLNPLAKSLIAGGKFQRC